MSTAPVSSTPRPTATRRHLTLVADPPRRTPAGVPQRIAAVAAGLACGFVLAAWATVIGGGSPGLPMAAASLSAALLFVALVACRASVRRRARAAARSTTPTWESSTPTRITDNVIPLHRAA